MTRENDIEWERDESEYQVRMNVRVKKNAKRDTDDDEHDEQTMMESES